jgi:hypothetical protein
LVWMKMCFYKRRILIKTVKGDVLCIKI